MYSGAQHVLAEVKVQFSVSEGRQAPDKDCDDNLRWHLHLLMFRILDSCLYPAVACLFAFPFSQFLITGETKWGVKMQWYLLTGS